ncbi:MAG: hypothetical protein AAGF11_26470 [Myxococcota bacterium]
MAQALIGTMPDPVPALLRPAATQLADQAGAAEAALTARRRESVPVDHSDENALATMASAMWTMLRDLLRAWSTFDRDELTVIRTGLRGKSAALLDAGRSKAHSAHALLTRLFGLEGLAFTQRSYPEQAQAMASILRLIDEDGLAPAIEEIAGPELLAGLRRCQSLYEAMVQRKLARNRARSINLAHLRTSLRRAIARYVSTMLALVDDDDPVVVAEIRAALRPVDVFRLRQARLRARATVERDEAASSDEGVEAARAAAGAHIATR